MPEIVSITLGVIFCIFIIVGCVAAISCAIMLFQMSSFLLRFAQAIDGLRDSIKEGFDAQTDAHAKVLEGNVKISNDNAQTLMNVLVTLAQMLELILKGLGYTPSSPADSGLKDLEPGPRQAGSDDLTYARK